MSSWLLVISVGTVGVVIYLAGLSVGYLSAVAYDRKNANLSNILLLLPALFSIVALSFFVNGKSIGNIVYETFLTGLGCGLLYLLLTSVLQSWCSRNIATLLAVLLALLLCAAMAVLVPGIQN